MSVKDLKKPIESLSENEDNLDEIDYYWDMHPTREDLMGQNDSQLTLLVYLLELLRWLYRDKDWFVGGDINVYKRRDPGEKNYPIAPDIAVFKNVKLTGVQRGRLRSWKMGQPNRPAPSVVFEFASHDTWREDLNQKPAQYGELGVREYFAYDPNRPPYWHDRSTRLRGWRYVEAVPVEIEANEHGWLWCEELDSWLVPDTEFLRLYDQDGHKRLNEAEEEAAAKEKAWAKLRELGIDPESL